MPSGLDRSGGVRGLHQHLNIMRHMPPARCARAVTTLVDPSRTAPRAHVRAPALDRTTYRFYTLKY
jgi:hypothetical protein